MARASDSDRVPRAPHRPRSMRRPASVPARTLVVLFLCAGIAVLGLLGGGEHKSATARGGRDPMAGYYGADMPRYPGAEELPAGRESQVGNAVMRMSYFDTEDDPAKVARFYANYWRERRLFVRHDVTHKGGVVSAVGGGGATIHQALLVVQGGRTLVFPSVTRSPLRAMEGDKEPPPVPLYPESKRVITMGSNEGGARARVFLSLNDGDLEANVVHYGRELRSAGFAPETTKQSEGAGSTQRILVFRRDGHEVTVSLTALDARRTRVHLMEVGAP
jgi:hypothetical protein